MLQRALSPVLVGRHDELSRLEDELLAASRGDGRLVLLAGEAGIGKTRLAGELSQRARKLGFEVLSGSCAETELAVPYLPFVEAIGNRLNDRSVEETRARLGPAAAVLARLFPQLAQGPPEAPAGDPAQAKLRLFESVVTLLELWSRERGLLLVLDDVHWADSSTRELLDYCTRRLARTRAMLLATYRSDELDRRHPLTASVLAWRRAGLAETIAVAAMTPDHLGEMIATILDADDVSADLSAAVAERAEGNPFVLEEMLREALDRGDIVRTAAGPAPEALPLPETVRDAVLLRLGRLDSGQIEVLRAGAVLGRTFEYALLQEVVDASEDVVLTALEAAVNRQLLAEATEAGRYTWRHALTQEAIVSDTVVPKRQRIHSRAADALAGREGSALAIAGHLLGAGRTDEAAPVCLRAADEAERAIAFGEAAELLERVLPHVADPADRGRLLVRMGHLRWLNGDPASGEQLLAAGIAELERLSLVVEAARGRIHLGRCRWELDRPAEALTDFHDALAVLEAEPPSAELALVHTRIAGIHAFQLEYDRCRESAQLGLAIAEEVGADFERVLALAFVALGEFGTSREFALLERCFAEALGKGYGIIAGNVYFNEIWDRVHTLAGGLRPALERLERIPFQPWMATGGSIAKGLARISLGELRAALDDARASRERHEALGATKFTWRSRLVVAEALLELGRPDEAAAELPPPAPGDELQDVVYDSAPRIGIALARGEVDRAVELARRVAGDDRVLIFRETAAVAIEALVAAGLLDEARDVLARSRWGRSNVGAAGLDLAEGRILLAEGDAAAARGLFERARGAFTELELPIWAARAGVLAARTAGSGEAAAALLAAAHREATQAGAGRVRDEARAAAAELGVTLVETGTEQDSDEAAVGPAGERFVTSMFADVRGYTRLTAASAPEEIVDRITTLHRWAATEVGRRHGIVDKFAGDAVMATFNTAGARTDHTVLALQAALALRDKAALMDLPIGIGIAAGAAIVTRSGVNVSVLGSTTNLAARLQTAAAGGEIVLSDEAHRRVAPWLEERGLRAEREDLELKGFDERQAAHRLRAPVPAAT